MRIINVEAWNLNKNEEWVENWKMRKINNAAVAFKTSWGQAYVVGIISPPPLPDWNSLHSIHFRFRFQNCRNTKLTEYSRQIEAVMLQGNLTRKKYSTKVMVIFAFKEISTYQIFVKRIFGETQGWKKNRKIFPVHFCSVALLNPWAPAGKRGARTKRLSSEHFTVRFSLVNQQLKTVSKFEFHLMTMVNFHPKGTQNTF